MKKGNLISKHESQIETLRLKEKDLEVLSIYFIRRNYKTK